MKREESGRSGRNKTLVLTPEDRRRLLPGLRTLKGPVASAEELADTVLHDDLYRVLPWLPEGFVDLLIADPPYNMAKSFNGRQFRRQSPEDYAAWLATWLLPLRRVLKPTASIYICGDWHTSASIFPVLDAHFTIRNRITWEREKGRSAKLNWKNCSEDIWFATCSEDFTFNAEAVRMKRRVIAPYRSEGTPRDWQREEEGDFRLTGASNFWGDITVPFWSMAENTEHPTQKPEKLIAKLILASSQPGAFVLDPFLGSGTTAVVCRKLGRRFCGVEIDRDYALTALKRLELAAAQPDIQGYRGGVFWERNSQPKGPAPGATTLEQRDGLEARGEAAPRGSESFPDDRVEGDRGEG